MCSSCLSAASVRTFCPGAAAEAAESPGSLSPPPAPAYCPPWASPTSPSPPSRPAGRSWISIERYLHVYPHYVATQALGQTFYKNLFHEHPDLRAMFNMSNGESQVCTPVVKAHDCHLRPLLKCLDTLVLHGPNCRLTGSRRPLSPTLWSPTVDTVISWKCSVPPWLSKSTVTY